MYISCTTIILRTKRFRTLSPATINNDGNKPWIIRRAEDTLHNAWIERERERGRRRESWYLTIRITCQPSSNNYFYRERYILIVHRASWKTATFHRHCSSTTLFRYFFSFNFPRFLGPLKPSEEDYLIFRFSNSILYLGFFVEIGR